VPGHDDREDRPADGGACHRPAPAVLQPVERRPDERGKHREGRHGDQQVEQHVAALGVRGGTEEDGAGERDRDHGVGAVAEHLVPDEGGQAGLVCPVLLAGADDLVRHDPRGLMGADDCRLAQRDSR
jgi:hypothetical protein